MSLLILVIFLPFLASFFAALPPMPETVRPGFPLLIAVVGGECGEFASGNRRWSCHPGIS